MYSIKCELCNSKKNVGHLACNFKEGEEILGRGKHCHICDKCKKKYYGEELLQKIKEIDEKIMKDIIVKRYSKTIKRLKF